MEKYLWLQTVHHFGLQNPVFSVAASGSDQMRTRQLFNRIKTTRSVSTRAKDSKAFHDFVVFYGQLANL